MSAEAKTPAVFLSYASQDAAAARRICEALRAAGVEVWFDQNELVGGDAWDAKIRRQIAECALFVPVISANTQARLEGYFRLEWKLAAQRTHTMADEKVFLLPVVIDETRDAEARVPAEFKAVQWFRLRRAFGGQVRASEGVDDPSLDDASVGAFSARVRQVLDGGDADVAAAPRAPEGIRSMRSGSGPGVAPSSYHPRRRWLLVGVGLGLAAVATVLLWRQIEGRSTVAASPPVMRTVPADSATAGSTMPAAASLSPARALVEKARALFEPWDLATKDDLVLAESFLKRAEELDPTDGEVWAARALLSCAFVGMSVTPENRRFEMRVQAERAVKLAPESDNARFAWAFAVRLEGKRGALDEVLPILREVVARNPTNRLMLRCLGTTLTGNRATRTEGLEVLARAAALPGGDAVAEFNLGQSHMYSVSGRNLKAALEAYNRSLRLAPNAHRTHSSKIELLLRFAGNLPAARQALREVPAPALREDRVVAIAVRVLLAADEPDEALRVLASTYPSMSTSLFTGPTAYLKGLAHRQAGRTTAANAEWEIALRELQRQLDATPTARRELLLKAATLAQLGRQTEAAAALELSRQLAGSGPDNQRVMIVKVLLGRTAEVITALEEDIAANPRFSDTPAFVLFEPEIAPLRADPGYAALAEKARAVYATFDAP